MECFGFKTNIWKNLGFPREFDDFTVFLSKFEFILKGEVHDPFLNKPT